MDAFDGKGAYARNAEPGRPVVVLRDDDPARIEALRGALAGHLEVRAARSDEALLDVLRDDLEVAAVLLDEGAAALDGLLPRLVELRPHVRRIVIAATPAVHAGRLEAGLIHHAFARGCGAAELVGVLAQLVRIFGLTRENHHLLGELSIANLQLREHQRSLEAHLESRGREMTAAAEQLTRMGHQLDALSLRDGLTGLYTHRAFQERLREEVARALRYGQPMSLLLVDIDGFASINYDLGFQVGDDILRAVSLILAEDGSPERARTSDVVARYSGEEFVLLLPETGKAGALTKAARLRDVVASADMPGSRGISVSIGVACLPDDAADAESLLTAVEAALRGAKRGARGRVHFFASGGSDERTTQPLGRMRDPEVDRFRPYHERMAEVTSILQRDRAISCLLLDLSRLHRVELDLGMAHHTEVYDRAAAVLEDLRGALLGPGDLICRTGDGDGYLVILSPRAGGPRVDLEALAGQVERAVEEALAPVVSALIREQPRITVGSARVLGNSMLRPERLIARLAADAADSARLARGRTALRDKGMLQDLILGEGLTSVYQPIVDLGTGDIFGYEALTRGPRGSALESPATLFAIADEVDLTVELDRACFRGALRTAINLAPVHRLFVNLLPMSFYDAGFIEIEVGNLLSAAGLTPANIVFEITERLAIENFAAFRRALAAYTAMGFGVAIDDVGTRHSNLETVLSLRPDFIKISDVLVRGIARSTVRREMLRSLRHIADTIDAAVVAEGIEDFEDIEVLEDLGLRYGQGYYMARPAPPFVGLRDGVPEILRATAKLASRETPPPEAGTVRVVRVAPDDDDDDEAERELDGALGGHGRGARPGAQEGLAARGPRDELDGPVADLDAAEAAFAPSIFGRAEDEVTGDYTLPAIPRPARGSEPPGAEPAAPGVVWAPLDDGGTSPRRTALLERLRAPTAGGPPPGSREDPSG